jgi:hypothetical protein
MLQVKADVGIALPSPGVLCGICAFVRGKITSPGDGVPITSGVADLLTAV